MAVGRMVDPELNLIRQINGKAAKRLSMKTFKVQQNRKFRRQQRVDIEAPYEGKVKDGYYW